MVKVFTPSDVLAVIREHVPEPNVRRFVLAYSGGLDSTVLLHLLAGELQGWSKAKLHAVHRGTAAIQAKVLESNPMILCNPVMPQYQRQPIFVVHTQRRFKVDHGS